MFKLKNEIEKLKKKIQRSNQEICYEVDKQKKFEDELAKSEHLLNTDQIKIQEASLRIQELEQMKKVDQESLQKVLS